ncbi:hypothetical protein COV93_00660 [Candidatus Woesearchaeota archaeon CG11_big_fil_rev_8_21_14_0_20_43_8]|nr:MAG: hypothetical protein COV93_00660 [Candidatus Woesearchaeota archaeon CG11_big_fil_rev_8_21_14_0_20_43_8]PIO06795.1 MAG: hypothetical protein COT47_02695 [Candidatus Woesearchaeota archaeon CG08_land_8_20_14_0_20_43_7]
MQVRDSFAEELSNIQNAEEELKRIDHLIYVSLKYTRTVDVFKNILQRFITTGDFLKEALLEFLKDKNDIGEVPENQALRADIIRREFRDTECVIELLNFHQMLRRINRADFTRKNEYRRHVTMTVIDGPDVVEIKIETLTEYYKRMKSNFMAIKELIGISVQ